MTELPTPANKINLVTEMPSTYLLFSKLEYLDFLMTVPDLLRHTSLEPKLCHDRDIVVVFSVEAVAASKAVK